MAPRFRGHVAPTTLAHTRPAPGTGSLAGASRAPACRAVRLRAAPPGVRGKRPLAARAAASAARATIARELACGEAPKRGVPASRAGLHWRPRAHLLPVLAPAVGHHGFHVQPQRCGGQVAGRGVSSPRRAVLAPRYAGRVLSLASSSATARGGAPNNATQPEPFEGLSWNVRRPLTQVAALPPRVCMRRRRSAKTLTSTPPRASPLSKWPRRPSSTAKTVLWVACAPRVWAVCA